MTKDEAVEYAIDSGWLVEVVNEHTCGTGKSGYDRHNGERMHLQAVVAELKFLLRRACETDAREDCSFDHNGGCQAHGFLGEPCPYPFIRQYLANEGGPIS